MARFGVTQLQYTRYICAPVLPRGQARRSPADVKQAARNLQSPPAAKKGITKRAESVIEGRSIPWRGTSAIGARAPHSARDDDGKTRIAEQGDARARGRARERRPG